VLNFLRALADSNAILTKESPVTEQMLSLKDAANYLGVSPNTVRNYIAKHGLKSQRVGPKLLKFRKADLDRFIER
jgi:excisionase family DNA binding protein